VRRIVDAHGGEMSIESSSGSGSKVHLRFPLTTATDD
jgi:signal transduction histidine kinase